jgi:uncharacterized membrane protein YfcA
MDLLNPLAGFVVGVLVGFTGVGGGALMTPLLVFLFGVAPQTAIGTDLLFASITKSVGTWVHGTRGSVDWLVLRRLASGSLPAAALTLLLIAHFPPDKELKSLLLPALGWALALTSAAMAFQPQLHRLGQRLMLVYLYPYRLTPAKLVGTDIAHAVPLTLVAGLGHLTLGNVDLGLLVSLLAGSIPGIILGSRLSIGVNRTFVRNAIALMLAVVGGKLLLSL